MVPRKYLSSTCSIILSLSILTLFTSCAHSPETAPEPLTGFFDKVTALVTTTVRGQLRDNPSKQELLMEQLPSFEKKGTMNQIMDEMKEIPPLRDLAYFIETDIMFELRKSEHHKEKASFNAPEIQREVVSAIIAGMKTALAQLKGGKDGK